MTSQNFMKNKPYIALSISIISVSSAAIFIRLISADALSIAFYRLLFTFLLITPFVFFSKKTRSELLKISTKNFLIMVLIGLILAFHFAFWISSLDHTSVASSVILVTAHPILVGPVSHFLLKEKLSFLNSFGIIISVTGVIILVFGNSDPFSGIQGSTFYGNILAILGGVMAGLYILGGRKLRKNISVSSYAFVVYAFGAMFLFVICLFFESELVNINLHDFQLIFLMALISGILGHTLYNWSLEHIRASVASVFLLGEPVGSTFFAAIIPSISEIPTIYTVIGGGIILSGIYLTTRKKKEEIISKI